MKKMKKIFYQNKKGLTFIEMIVSIAILTIGMAGFTMLFSRSWKTNSFILEESMSSIQATQSVRKVAAQLRGIRQAETGAYMIALADEDQIVTYMDIDGDDYVERVRYYLDDADNTFVRGVAEYSGGTYPTGYAADAETTLAAYVVNTEESEPVFRYYNNSNNEIASPAIPNSIRIIELNLWVNIKPMSAPDNVRIGTSVEIRNLDEGI